MRTCSKCEKRKAATQFYASSGNRCKACIKESEKLRSRRKRKKNPSDTRLVPEAPPGTKWCGKCKQFLSIAEFWTAGSGRPITSPCKACRYVVVRRNYERRRQELLLYARNYWLEDQYGITLAQYNTLHTRQNGVCALCGKPPKSKRRLSVDHCHETGKIRGLLCPPCNTSLGVLGDTPEAFKRVLAYLEAECLTKSL